MWCEEEQGVADAVLAVVVPQSERAAGDPPCHMALKFSLDLENCQRACYVKNL
jgi:hypothetical protein